MRECPIFEVDITEERSTQVYVAAETSEQAEEVALKMRRELDWFSAVKDYSAYAAMSNPNPSDVRAYGIWVPDLNDGQGGWVHSIDDVPMLPPKLDPNQLVLDLTDETDLTDDATALPDRPRFRSRISTVHTVADVL